MNTSPPDQCFVSAATFEWVMQVGFPQKGKACVAKRMALRDQALLWVLFEIGITASEVCALRVADLDQRIEVLRGSICIVDEDLS